MERVEETIPAPMPNLQELNFRVLMDFKFFVPRTPFLLTIFREKVGPPTHHIPAHMLNENRDAIQFFIRHKMKISIT